ncbi:RTA1-like protein [Mycena venus]|uniref:RTA1-like protein n=1 Tax=Mycena venus TaxID=2733690 RepID=A0A8H7CF41_9AGAR|nr:RTA1-like protein [Mycena venus]
MFSHLTQGFELTPRAEIHNPYHYTPTRWICITFVSLFGLSTILHITQAIIFSIWYMLPTAALCGTLEIVGWLARLSSSKNPHNLLPYEIQMTATIVGPTPLLAANFLTLGKLVERLGPRYCRLPPKMYSIMFLACDLVALCVQAAGGAIASIAVGKKRDPESGGHIMLGGIIFQLIAILAYVSLAAEFLVRYTTERPMSKSNEHRGTLTPRLRLLVGALALNTLCLVVRNIDIDIRAIYRTVELINGFSGPIISTQWYFNVFDGMMIALAILIVNVAHPGILLRQDDAGAVDKERAHSSEVQLKLMGSI